MQDRACYQQRNFEAIKNIPINQAAGKFEKINGLRMVLLYCQYYYRVKQMPRKYNSLNDLIQDDFAASEYFMSLPEYVKEQIRQREDHINSLESLQDYAENLLRGMTERIFNPHLINLPGKWLPGF